MAKMRVGVKKWGPVPTCLYSSPIGAAGPVAICLQLIIPAPTQVKLPGQLLAQHLQLLVELITVALEEAKHQQVCDALFPKA
jgi:hypothetical protein